MKKNREHSRSFEEVLTLCRESDDFINEELLGKENSIYYLSYFSSLCDSTPLNEFVFNPLKKKQCYSLEDIKEALPLKGVKAVSSGKELEEGLNQGQVLIRFEQGEPYGILASVRLNENRQISIPEMEYTVIGPKEAFVENLDVNLNLLRNRLPTSSLCVKKVTIGTISRTEVAVVYLKDIANKDNVQTMIQRIEAIEYDEISDTSYINQFIEDNSNSPFPQLIDTERPDRVAAQLTEGKIAVLSKGSPSVILAPTTMVEFFSAFEDYYIPWHLASAFRLIRLFAVLFSVFSTPMYVAVLTYHAELIPQDLLATLIMSRSIIPFPPIFEAIFLELTIELLREAGARLPTKVGQTIGIVGGIVIGTAAVEAGLTSNVLLIIVALAALASFTTPIYRIGNTIRLIRFPFLLMAQLWGLLGISLLGSFLLVHIITLKSLGRPYLEPVYPFRFRDFKDAFIRVPFSKQYELPELTQTAKPERFSKKKAKKHADIDEHIR
ncbi:spore germination protein [Alteribacter natronophilus]|uniref:spore germination protein n=1 Tax=Alteribacter natronophilus TaxID=2583810 RepID=UPI00110E07A6|nr:spore germination protein [Alteribacter natronophilus]TMW73369.1 spore germination protein [Alteribacter natronophilus]